MKIFENENRPIFYKKKLWNFRELYDHLKQDSHEEKISESHDYPIGVLDFLVELKLSNTTSEARRYINGNAVSIDNQKIIDFRTIVIPTDGMIVRVGKRKILKIRLIKNNET